MATEVLTDVAEACEKVPKSRKRKAKGHSVRLRNNCCRIQRPY